MNRDHDSTPSPIRAGAVNGIIEIEAGEAAIQKRTAMLDAHVNAYLHEEGFAPTRARIMSAGPQIFPKVEVSHRLECERYGESEVYALSADAYENIVLYLHGGAWVFGIFESHVKLCDSLADRLNARVYMPQYPIAAAHTYRETYAMLVDLYDDLLKQNKPIFLMGDSAGGTLALGLIDIFKRTGRPMPARVIPISPCVDLTFSNPDMVALESRDPMDAVYGCLECAKLWAGGTDLSDPALTALSRDLTGYPPIMLFASTEDILYPDEIRLFEMMRAAGEDITLIRGVGLWHVFCVFEVPERETALSLFEDFCLHS